MSRKIENILESLEAFYFLSWNLQNWLKLPLYFSTSKPEKRLDRGEMEKSPLWQNSCKVLSNKVWFVAYMFGQYSLNMLCSIPLPWVCQKSRVPHIMDLRSLSSLSIWSCKNNKISRKSSFWWLLLSLILRLVSLPLLGSKEKEIEEVGSSFNLHARH